MAVVGLDIGSTAAKGVLIEKESKYYALLPTGWSPRDTAGIVVQHLLENAGLLRSQIEQLWATGYGRVALAEADQTVTEIKCQARGVHALYPEVRTIIDIGGQDSKVIKIEASGRVVDFAMNDKCAAGTGRFLQVMATALGMDVSELGENENVAEMVSINSMCTVFAESEIIGLLARNVGKDRIIAGLHKAVAARVAGLAKRMGVERQVAFTGGVAANPGVRRALTKELQCDLIVAPECFYTGALGAALLAAESLTSSHA